MIHLDFLQNCNYFQKIELDIQQILFNEGQHDENIYIVYDGELTIEKQTKQSKQYKILSHIYTGNIVGTGWFIKQQKQEVRIKAVRKTTLLMISGDRFVHFMGKYPSESYELLIHIISYLHERLIEANSEIIGNYEIAQAISSIQSFNVYQIEKILETIKIILNSEKIIYLEKNDYIKGYYKIKYTHGISNLLGKNMILSFGDNSFSLEQFKLQEQVLKQTYMTVTSLKHSGKLRGYLIISRNQRKYTQHEQKLFESASVSFAGVIEHKEILEIEENKRHIKNIM